MINQKLLVERLINTGKSIFNLNRSLVSSENERSIVEIEKNHNIHFKRLKFPSGSRVFDWIVPRGWELKAGYLKTSDGHEVCNINANLLHVANCSGPVHQFIRGIDLVEFIHTLPDRPGAIPYVTKYYDEASWGICLDADTANWVCNSEDEFEVFIDSRFYDSELSIYELECGPASGEEIWISSYLCHPNLANNELSGILALVGCYLLLKANEENLRYKYKFLLWPETLGCLCYLSTKTLNVKKPKAAFILSCMGDERTFSITDPSVEETELSKLIKYFCEVMFPHKNIQQFTWKERGSDERQFSFPTIDVPTACFSRSKFCEYPEYHTSEDLFDSVVTKTGLNGGISFFLQFLDFFETNVKPRALTIGEPQLGRRGLYDDVPARMMESTDIPMGQLRLDLLHLTNGRRDLVDISILTGFRFETVRAEMKNLKEHRIIEY